MRNTNEISNSFQNEFVRKCTVRQLANTDLTVSESAEFVFGNTTFSFEPNHSMSADVELIFDGYISNQSQNLHVPTCAHQAVGIIVGGYLPL